MAKTDSRSLTLTSDNNTVTVEVRYRAIFTPLDRFLATRGLKFLERIQVIGVDPAGSATGDVLYTFPTRRLEVTQGSTVQVINRRRTVTVPRQTLEEDPDFFGITDEDEIRCKIQIVPFGLPKTVIDFTDQATLSE